MYKLFRPILFLFNPEFIHHISFKVIKIGALVPLKMWTWRFLFKVSHPKLEREVFGLKFENPVGLAAGFDKDAEELKRMSPDLSFKPEQEKPDYTAALQSLVM